MNKQTTPQPVAIWSFEIVDQNGIKQFIQVVNRCLHYYTGETMRYIRRHYVEQDGRSVCVYEFVNEAEWANLLTMRVVE